jgi:hypothetical protein
MPGEQILLKTAARMNDFGTPKYHGVALSNTSLKREKISRQRHEAAKKSAKSELSAKQNNLWKNPFLSKGFRQRNQIISETGLCREPGQDNSDTSIDACEPNGTPSSSDGDFSSEFETGEHGMLPDRVSFSRSGLGRDGINSKSPVNDSDNALDSRISFHTTVFSGKELAIEREFVLCQSEALLCCQDWMDEEGVPTAVDRCRHGKGRAAPQICRL